MRSQLGIQASQMPAHRLEADAETLCDLAVLQPFGQQTEYFALTECEPVLHRAQHVLEDSGKCLVVHPEFSRQGCLQCVAGRCQALIPA